MPAVICMLFALTAICVDTDDPAIDTLSADCTACVSDANITMLVFLLDTPNCSCLMRSVGSKTSVKLPDNPTVNPCISAKILPVLSCGISSAVHVGLMNHSVSHNSRVAPPVSRLCIWPANA